jgi:hypothetical protein
MIEARDVRQSEQLRADAQKRVRPRRQKVAIHVVLEHVSGTGLTDLGHARGSMCIPSVG